MLGTAPRAATLRASRPEPVLHQEHEKSDARDATEQTSLERHWGRIRGRVGGILICLLAAWAYAPLILSGVFGSGASAVLPDARDAERFFFEPHQSDAVLVLLIAGGLLWRRRDRFRALPARSAPLAAGCAFAAALGLGIWARLNAAEDLMVLSLIAVILGFALAARGAAGVRVLAAPLVALLFAIPIPGRLQNEIIWHLQLWSAAGAHGLLTALGLDVSREGLLLTRGDAGFLVIESCSGFRSMHILLLVTLVLRDLFELRRHAALLFLAAPGVAMLLNGVRIAWIVWGAEPNASAEEHVGQGLAVLGVGTLVLFGLAWWMQRKAADPALASVSRAPAPSQVASPAMPAPALRMLLGALAILGSIPLLLAPWPPPQRALLELDQAFGDRPGWQGEDIASDRIFIGSVSIGKTLHRRLTREALRFAPQAGVRGTPPSVVEVFVGLEARSYPRWSPFSDLLMLPARDWGIEASETRQDWRLFRPVEEAIATRGEQRALVRVWRVGDAGIFRETLRSLLALERGPFERRSDRAVVRLVTAFDRDEPRSVDQARERLDQFVIDFGPDFDRIEGR